MRVILHDLFKDETGASAIEYGFIMLLIAVACIAAITRLGTQTSDFFTTAGNAFG
ncbi:MAG: Flp family type IVb pilin [Alphaproteobacteria bacterium]|nr:Flp family type IVb pilin [Alphaproteobacteria bacterium]